MSSLFRKRFCTVAILSFVILALPASACDDPILKRFLSDPSQAALAPIAHQLEGDIAFRAGIKDVVDSYKSIFYGHVVRTFAQWENHCFVDLVELIPKGNPNIVELGFLLYRLSDGGNAEDLAAALGLAINVEPELVLGMIDKYKLHGPEAEDIVYGIPVEMVVDDLPKSLDELLKRKKAVESVQNSRLASIRASALTTLDRHILETKESIDRDVTQATTPSGCRPQITGTSAYPSESRFLQKPTN